MFSEDSVAIACRKMVFFIQLMATILKFLLGNVPRQHKDVGANNLSGDGTERLLGSSKPTSMFFI